MPSDKRARQREKRDLKRIEEEKQAKRENRRRVIIRYVVIVGIALAAFYLLSLRGGDGESDAAADTTTTADATTTTLAFDASAETESTTTLASQPESPAPTALTQGPADYAGFRDQPTACGAQQPPERQELSFSEPGDAAVSGTVTATVTTSCGDIVMSLDADASPETVNSFVFLAEEGFFDGTACHRLVDGFVLQCGDPDATGRGGPGYDIADEFPEEGFTYGNGVIAMANAGAGTTGSQFFVVTGDGSFLPPSFSILGSVVGSEDTIAALSGVTLGIGPSGEQSSPLETIYIESVTVGS